MRAESALHEIVSLRAECHHGEGAALACPFCIARAALDSRPRVYLDARYDVTDLTQDERGQLAIEVQAQAEHSDGHPSVGVEIEWSEVEQDA